MGSRDTSRNIDEPIPEEAHRVFQSLLRESNRGCALVAAAYLDELSRRRLSKCMRSDKRELKAVFEGTGPLATFSSKIRLLYLLRVVGKSGADMLHEVRRVRNEFAHQHEEIDFSNPRVLRVLRGGWDRVSRGATPTNGLIRKYFLDMCGWMGACIYVEP